MTKVFRQGPFDCFVGLVFGVISSFLGCGPGFCNETTQSAPRAINMRVVPRWVDSDHFWFARETESGVEEIVDVDASTGALSVRSGSQQDGTGVSDTAAQLRGGPIPKSGYENIDDTEIHFINRSGHDVQVFWVDSAGERVPYAKISDGKSFKQHTFAGHAWEVVDNDGGFYGSIVASVKPCEAVITEAYPHVDDAAADDTKENQPRRERGRWSNDRWELRLENGRLQRRELVEKKPEAPSVEEQEDWVSVDSINDLLDSDTKKLFRPEFSPDGRFLAAWILKPAEEMYVYTIESSPKIAGRARLEKRDYPLPGDKLNEFELVFYDTETWQRVPVALPTIDFESPTMHWRGDHDLLIEKIDRGHQRFRLFLVDPAAGEVKTPIDETSETFIWTAHKQSLPLVTYLKETDEVIYASEKDGWRHLYLVDLSEKNSTQPITKGDFLVRDMLQVDEKNRRLDLVVGEFHDDQDPYHQHLVSIGFDGENLLPITQADGDHSFEFSPDRKYAITTHSRVDLPPVHELRRMSDGLLLATLATAQMISGGEGALVMPTVFSAKGRDGETDIWGMISFPPGYDPASDKKYPVIEAIYAGPHGSHVPKRFRPLPWSPEYTSLGFIVVRIDGMGTANRSKAFHDVCWHNLKDAGFPDRIAWMKAAAEKYPAMDLDRVGIYGTSAGGQNACGALLFHGDFYKAAMGSCGCHDNRMDKASWNEQWMGVPVGPHYAESSNIDNAHRLQGDLLLLVGELDDNVPPESTLRLVDALIKADKRFDFLLIPGMGHSDGDAYGRKLTLEFFCEKLKP